MQVVFCFFVGILLKSETGSCGLRGNFPGNGMQRHNLIGGTQLDGFLGHAEHDTALLVLRHRARTGIVHFAQAAGTIVAHAGHDNTERIFASILGYGTEQHVHRRTMAVDQRAILNFDVILRAAALEQHMPSAGRNQRQPRNNPVAVMRLADFNLANAVEPCRERSGEFFRHVLHYHNAGRYPW